MIGTWLLQSWLNIRLEISYFFFEVVYEDDLQDDLQDFQDPVEDEHFVWEVLNVSVKTAGDDGECRVIGDDCLGGGELSIIYNVKPGGKEQDS